MSSFIFIPKRAVYVFLLSMFVLTNLLTPHTIDALSTQDLNDILRKHPYYSAEDCEVSTSTDLLGSDNTEIGFRYFVGKGFSAMHAAAITGNFVFESGGLNPTAFNPAGGGQGAYGIAQWRAGRQSNLKNKTNYHTLPVQLDFVWEELQTSHKRSFDEINLTSTIEDATETFEKWYEGSGGVGNSTRIKNAKEVLATYGSSNLTSVSSISSSQDCSGIVGSGQDTKYVDGFTIYSQYDPSWKDLPFSSSTIGISGCGPSAMAMIITAMTGKNITPVEAANYAASQNIYIPGVGSSWTIATKLSEKYGLKASAIGADLGKIAATLQAGGLVIAAGDGAKPFTSGGHYIVIRALTAEGKFKIGDSAHSDTSEQVWDPSQLITNMHGGSVYAIFTQ